MLCPRFLRAALLPGRGLLIGLLVALAGGALSSEPEVEFPGPILRPTLGAPFSAAVVPWDDGVTDYLVVGDDIGYVSLYYHFLDNTSFLLLARRSMGPGTIVALDIWRHGPAGARTLVAAMTDPDRLVFLEIQTQDPFISVLQSVDLPEDPRQLAFLDPTASGEERLAVSLPGVDSLALLREQEGVWSLQGLLPAGDHPVALATLDRDADGQRDLLCAGIGPLSGTLGVYGQDDQGTYALEGHWALNGHVTDVLAGDFDQNGRDEFVVSYTTANRLDMFAVEDGQPVLRQSLDLVFVPDRIQGYDLFNGHPAIVTSNQALGLVEFLEFLDGQWVSRETFYAGCRPLAVQAADLNGDGYQELNCLDSSLEAFTILLGNNGPGYWGYRSRPLGTTPLNFVAGDFDGDQDEDVVVSGIDPTRLVVFSLEMGHGLLAAPRHHDLDIFPGALCVADFLGDEAEELGVVDLYRGGLVLLDLSGPGEPQEVAFLDLVQVPGRLSTGDVDGDGRQDIIAILNGNSLLHVYFGDGAGGFSVPVVVDLPLGLYDARSLDLDGDGRRELVASDGQSRVWVVANQTGRAFGVPLAVSVGSGARHLALADLDGDLDLDVVVGNTNGESLSLLENMGNGTLACRVCAMSLPDGPGQVVARDLNGDALADILVTLGNGTEQQLFLSRAPWDYGFAITLESSPSIYRTHLADFNDDQKPDILNLDNELELAVVLRNTALEFVPVQAPRLRARCDGPEWIIRIEAGGNPDWVLYATDGRQRRELARPDRAALGRLDRLEEGWRLTLDPARWWADPDGLHLELVSGELVQRLRAPEDCAGAALPHLRWQSQPWPNPFNPHVEARIRLPEPSFTRVTVHDVAGRRVATLLAGALAAGPHRVVWDGRDGDGEAAAGVYFLRVQTEQGVLTSKISLIK